MGVDYLDDSPKQSQKPKKVGSTTPILDNFSRDLVKLAEEGKIDPVVGRDNEVKRISQILSRKKKNNAVIVGDAGVGKTALVEKLALMIYKGECPTPLLDKRLVSLDLTSIVAGTKYRGQFEERIKAILVELLENPNIIVFIDELHTMVGAGNASGSMDASNILKPALARGEIQCIGSTTFDDYKKYIEKDQALVRRFQKIILKEPTKIETIEILTNLKSSYEDFHKVKYEDNVIETIVMLSERYITDRQFPDKAIDVLDELGAEKKISGKIPQSIENIKAQIDDIKKQKLSVVKLQQYEKAAQLRDDEKGLLLELENEKMAWEERKKGDKKPVSVEDVFALIATSTGIPTHKLDKNESDYLLKLEEILSSKVIGQDEAISVISKAIRRNRVGLNDENKPQASFIFCGNSGIGKTYLAKQMSLEIFGSENNLIRIDMSEYQEKHNISKLIGTTAGYIGYDEGGYLTEKIKNNPYCIILFDEIEKAHKDIFTILLQILDDGYVTDGQGTRVNFKNTLIILTTNLGVKKAQEFGAGIGFRNGSTNNGNNKKESIIKEIKQFFLPEFINRIDEIIVFNTLTPENIEKICAIELDKLISRLNQLEYSIQYDSSLVKYLSKIGFDEIFGARPMKRAIQDKVGNLLSDEILKNTIKKKKIYIIKVVNEKIEIVTKTK